MSEEEWTARRRDLIAGCTHPKEAAREAEIQPACGCYAEVCILCGQVCIWDECGQHEEQPA